MHPRLVAALAALIMLTATVSAVAALDQDPTNALETTASTVGAEACTLESSTNETLTPNDVEIAITVHKPELDEGETVPLILHSHGWSGSRNTDAGGLVGDLVDACYGVVSIDMRGHGDSGGQAHVHSPDKEIQDVIGILDWTHDELDWVTKEPGTGVDKDLRAGAIGGSYGGGYQLLTAALDERLDALAPEITWNSLPYALAPNGAVKSGWVDLLYAAGAANADMAPFIHQGYAWANAFNEFPDGEDPGEPDVLGKFVASSPASYPDAIDVPTLLIQGMPDALFNLNQAVDNHHQIEAASTAEVSTVTHLGGHIISTDGTLPGDAPVTMGLQPAAGPSPCADTDELVIRWYDEHLKGLGDDGAERVELALDDGTCLDDAHTADLVLGDAAARQVALEGPVAVTQGAPTPSGFLQAGPVEATLESPVTLTAFEVDDETAITGIPRLTADATVAGPGAIAYLSIVVEDGDGPRVVNSQVTPIRLTGPDTTHDIDVELAGIGAALDAGDVVKLQISSFDTQYAHNAERTPGALLLEDMTLSLPVQ